MDPRSLPARLMGDRRVAGVRTVLDTYGRAAGGLLANGLAFSALFTAIPLTLLLLGVAGGIAAEDPAIRDEVRRALVAAAPPLTALIDESIRAIGDGSVLTSAVGAAGVIWTVSQLFGALEVAFARIFSDEPERDALQRTLRGFMVVGLIVTVVIAVIGVVGILAAFDAMTGRRGSQAQAVLAPLASPLVPWVAACLAVTLCYRTLPPRSPTWRALLIPAAIVGTLLAVLSQAFTLLVPRLVGVAALAGSLASGFVMLAWLSLSFQALLLGAAWVRVRSQRPARGAGSGAEWGSASLDGAAAPAELGAGGK